MNVQIAFYLALCQNLLRIRLREIYLHLILVQFWKHHFFEFALAWHWAEMLSLFLFGILTNLRSMLCLVNPLLGFESVRLEFRVAVLMPWLRQALLGLRLE
jgi:hypothetical protein